VSFATCGECAGVWLTRKALAAPSLEPARLPAESRRAHTQRRSGRRSRVCPECTRALESQSVEGVEIERCAYCKGVWLDAGEYDAVRKRIELQPPMASDVRRETGLDLVGAGFEVAFEALVTTLFGGLF
jgi:Zn-finger nucleic acid-binding protein